MPDPDVSPAPRSVDRIYPVRVLNGVLVAAICLAAGRDAGGLGWLGLLVTVAALVYPHLVHLAGGFRDGARREAMLVLSDAALLGAAAAVAGGAFLPGMVLLAMTLSNALGLAGGRIAAVAAGVFSGTLALGLLLTGGPTGWSKPSALELAAAATLLVSWSVFAWVAHRSSGVLRRSRVELRQEKLLAEVERERVRRLLHHVAPAEAVEQLEKRGSADPRRLARAGLLLLELDEVDGELDAHGPDRVLAGVAHASQVFVAVSERHGFTVCQLSRHRLLAIDRQDEVDLGLAAGLEIRDALVRIDDPELEAVRPGHRLLLHRGPCTTGLLGALRGTWQAWGLEVERAESAIAAVPPGAFALSAAVVSILGERTPRHRTIEGGLAVVTTRAALGTRSTMDEE